MLALCGALFGGVAKRPDVILVSIDTLRADHLSCYGYGRKTPQIDSFGEGGTVFSAIDSQIPLTLPSHTVLFTSRYPFETGVEENAELVPGGLTTLAGVLKKNGYGTGAFIGSSMLAQRYRLNQGFDTYDSPFAGSGRAITGPYDVRVRRDGALVMRAALNWMQTMRGKQPAFAFIHLFDLHTPYSARGFTGERLTPNVAGYDAEIQYVDRLMGSLKEALIRSGEWQQALVVLVSDHGESLGDHGETSHGYFAYESTLHVPLIVHWPAGEAGHAQRVDEPAGLVDVAPTILDALGIEKPESFEGTSLLRSGGRRTVYSETDYAHDAFHWAALRRLREGATAWVSAPREELYDLSADGGERHNIAGSHTNETGKFEAELHALFSKRAKQSAQQVSADSALRSLGYVGRGGSGQATGGGADPKDKLGEYQEFEKALAELYGGRENAAAERLRGVLAKDGKNTMALYYLGEADLKAGRPEKALEDWHAAVEQDGTYEPVVLRLGELYLAKKQAAKAREALARAAVLAPADYEAGFELSAAEEELGLLEDALRHRQAACELAEEFEGECGRSVKELLGRMGR